ncbi:hypothetical protein V8C35DRAFT_305350 [Trichoderma chlorosporum]
MCRTRRLQAFSRLNMGSQNIPQASSHLMASVSAETDAIEGARKAYDELLEKAKKKKKKSLQTLGSATSIDDIIGCLQNAHDSYRRRTSSKLLECFQKNQKWLEYLSVTIDTACQRSNTMPFSIGTPLQLCLQVSNYHSIVVEQIVTMFDAVHPTMDRIDIYKQLPQNKALYAALSHVFTDIVNFCYIALSFYSHNALVRLFKFVGSPTKTKFQGIINNLKRHTKQLDLLVAAIGVKEIFQKRMVDCIKSLDPPKMNEKLEDTIQNRVPETCSWILSQELFNTWTTTDKIQERLLCVSGKSGCGKTFLAATVIENLTTKFAAGKERRVVNLFFSGTETTSRQPANTLARASLAQILKETRDGDKLNALLSQIDKLGDFTTKGLWKIVLEAMQQWNEPTFWVIDGLDECLDGTDPLNGKNNLDHAIKSLMELLLELLHSHPSSRVIIFGRPHAINAVNEGSIPHLTITIDEDMIKEDLNKFILTKTTTPFFDQTAQKDLQDHVGKELLRKSEGTFLWLDLVMNDVQSWSSSYEAIESLNTLPKGLEGRYKQILNRLEKSLKDFDIDVATQIFGFLATAGRPLDIDELRYAQGIALWKKKKSQGNEALNDGLADELETPQKSLKEYLIDEALFEKKILRLCGEFVHIRNREVIFVHLTAKRYLLKFAAETRFKIDFVTSHRIFGDICVESLILAGDSLARIDSGAVLQTTAVSSPPLVFYAIRYLIHHLKYAGPLRADSLGHMKEFIQTDGFVNWVNVLMKQCFDFRFLQDMTQDLTSVMERIDLRDLMDLVNSINPEEFVGTALETVISSISKDFEEKKQSWKSRLAEDPNLELVPTQSISVEDQSSTNHLNVWNLFGGHGETAARKKIDIRHIQRFLENNNALPIAPTLGALKSLGDWLIIKSLRTSMVLSSLPQTLGKILDPLDEVCRLIKNSSAAKPTILLIGIAFLFISLKKDELALQTILEAKQQLGRHDILYKFLIGRALYGLGQHEEAEKLLREVISSTSAIMTIVEFRKIQLYLLGLTLYRQNKVNEAEEIFKKSISLKSGPIKQDSDTSFWLGRCLYDQGKYDEAEAAFKQGISLKDPSEQDSADALWLGKCLYEQKKFQEAEAMLRQSISLEMPGKHDSLGDHWLGVCLFHQEKYEEAEDLLMQCISPEMPSKYDSDNSHWLGRSLYCQKRFDEAENMFRQSISLKGSGEQVSMDVFWLGMSLVEQEKYKEAEAVFKQNISVNTDQLDSVGYHWLGISLARQEKYKEAETFFEQSISLKTGPSEIDSTNAFWLGKCLYEQDKYEEAEAVYRGSVSLERPSKDDPSIAFMLGISLYCQKKYDEAENWLKHSICLRSKPCVDGLRSACWLAKSLYCRKSSGGAASISPATADDVEKYEGGDLTEGLEASCRWLAGVYKFFEQNYAEAEEVLKQTLADAKDLSMSMTQTDSGFEMRTAVWLGRALKQQSKYVEARMILRPVLQELKDRDILNDGGFLAREDEYWSTNTEAIQDRGLLDSSKDTYWSVNYGDNQGIKRNSGSRNDVSIYDYDAHDVYNYTDDAARICADYFEIRDALQLQRPDHPAIAGWVLVFAADETVEDEGGRLMNIAFGETNE